MCSWRKYRGASERCGTQAYPPHARRGSRLWRGRAAGLTLAETVIAMAIIGLALVPLMMMLPGGSRAQFHAQRVMLCTLFAEQKMEEAKSALIADFNGAPGGEGDFSTDGYAEYRYSITVADVSGRPLKSIHVLVWADENGDGVVASHERQTTLDTLVARAVSRSG